MNFWKLIVFYFVVTACSSNNKVIIHGYSGGMLYKAQKASQGKGPEAVLKLLGRPAVHGECRTCAKYPLYRIIYLTKDRQRFYLNLSYNTDQEIDCLVLDFIQDKKTKKYVFDSNKGFQKKILCNQKGGAILDLKDKLEAEAAQKVSYTF